MCPLLTAALVARGDADLRNSESKDILPSWYVDCARRKCAWWKDYGVNDGWCAMQAIGGE